MPKSINRELAKLTKVPHPKGRKTAQLQKKSIKLEHRQKTKHAHTIKTNISAERYLWFRDQLSDSEACPPGLLLNLIEIYLSRFDDELEQIAIKHDIGGKRNRQHASREDIIKMTKANEEEEFKTCGVEIPDVFNPKQFKLLKTWNGELRYLQNFKLTRFNKTKLQSMAKVAEDKIESTEMETAG